MPITLKSGKTVNVQTADVGAIRATMNAVKAGLQWAKDGFTTLPGEQVKARMDICLSCKEWIPDARFGLGKCKVCKCSCLKHHLPSEKCPLSKWPAVDTKKTLTQKVDPAKLWDGSDADKILHYHRGQTKVPRRPLPDLSGHGCTTSVYGLGDTVILTDLARRHIPVFSASPCFDPLMRLNPGYTQSFDHRKCIDNSRLIYNFDCGNGHYIQRLQRAFGLSVIDLPEGSISVDMPKVKGRVVMHWEAGKHQEWQFKHVHPQARILYAQNRAIIEQFIKDHQELEFIEIGKSASIKGAEHQRDLLLFDTISLISSAEYFIGITSGPMHLAAAMGVRSVIVVNFPDADKMLYPTICDNGQVESEWHYPQNVHLHQDNEGPLVPRFSLKNLERAFAGEVYPYWSDQFLPLIHEKL